MKFQRQLREELSINLTPLIDVVFLLLIFFMVTTTFSKETHLAVSLPEADGKLYEQKAAQIEILISKNGRYSINGKSLVNSKLDTLMAAIRLEAGEDKNIPMLITADAEASHQAVVTAMDGIGRLGFNHLSIATKRPVKSN